MSEGMTRTATEYSYEHANEHEIIVDGTRFLVWDNYMGRCTQAENYETGEIKELRCNGYLGSERTIRRRIREMVWD